MDLFNKLGVSYNAYTSFDRTVYYFSGNSNFNEALEILVNYPFEFEMSNEAVEGEKDIIIKEAKMYRLYNGIFRAMYTNHPIRNKIIGEIDEIKSTTLELLNKVHQVFYNPEDMYLVLAGDFNIEEMLRIIESNLHYKNNSKLSILKKEIIEEEQVNEKNVVEDFDLKMDKLAIGYKLKNLNNLSNRDKLKVSTAINIILGILFSKSSNHYQEIINSGLASDFNYESLYSDNIFSVFLLCESSKIEEIKEYLINAIKEGKNYLNEDDLETIKREELSDIIYGCNSVDRVASNFISQLVDNNNYFEQIEVIKEIDFDYISKIYDEYLTCSDYAIFHLRGKKND